MPVAWRQLKGLESWVLVGGLECSNMAPGTAASEETCCLATRRRKLVMHRPAPLVKALSEKHQLPRRLETPGSLKPSPLPPPMFELSLTALPRPHGAPSLLVLAGLNF
jgi:hypothetical protein